MSRGKEQQAEAAIIAELEGLKNGPITQEEVDDWLPRPAFQHGRPGDSLAALENWYYGQITRGEPLYPPEYGKVLTSAVTLDEVRQTLQSYSYSVCYAVTAEPGTQGKGGVKMLNNDHKNFAAAQARAAAAVSCESVVLPSGLTVLCRTMPGYSSVHAIYATGFGSIHRAFKLDGKQVTLPAGTAHFLEHKMCETPKGDSFTFYAKTGASANAFTSYDRTCYLFSATQKINENLDILLGMVGKPWFTKATIEKEQGIIGQEIKMYDDSPDWRLLNALFRCLYADHPLRDDIAGTVESIAELTPQMLYNCTKAFYAPSNMVLSVAGKITLAQAVDACKRNGLYRARAPHEVEWDIPAQDGPLPHKEAFFTMPVTKPCFGVAYREEPLAPGDLKRELLLDMLGDLVVGGLTKLYRRLYDEALVNPEFSGDFIAVRGACAVAFTGESDTPRQVMDLLQEEIERMRREGVDPEVFMLVKNQMYGELLGDVEAVDDAAEEAAAACLKGRTLADEIAALAELTAEDANALMQTALREENRAYVQIDPAEK